MPAAIEFESVSKRFRGGALALDGASWAVPEGARACLLGPNGAGKSTSVRLLEGALSPTSGAVRLLGQPAGTSAYRLARRQTGIVPQGPGMYPDLTAGEYLDLAARLYGRYGAGTPEIFGLGEQLGTRMADLSGGFQRRLSLAAALIGDPSMLLLDEPTVGLDPVAAHEVQLHLRRIMPGRTVLLCTHNLAEAEALCDLVVILRQGRVVVQSSLADLRRGSRPRLRLAVRQGTPALLAALGAGPRAEADTGGVLLQVDDPAAEAPALLRRLLGAGLDVFECTPVQPSLEDLFLEAVG